MGRKGPLHPHRVLGKLGLCERCSVADRDLLYWGRKTTAANKDNKVPDLRATTPKAKLVLPHAESNCDLAILANKQWTTCVTHQIISITMGANCFAHSWVSFSLHSVTHLHHKSISHEREWIGQGFSFFASWVLCATVAFSGRSVKKQLTSPWLTSRAPLFLIAYSSTPETRWRPEGQQTPWKWFRTPALGQPC